MKIKKLIIDNFRGFKHAEIDFNDFNCIVGKNDVGKSTILEALRLFFDDKNVMSDDNFNLNVLEYEEEEGCLVSGDEMFIEIQFKGVVPYFFQGNDYYNFFRGDFESEDHTFCIRKECLHSDSFAFVQDEVDVPRVSYKIKGKIFDGCKKPLSLQTKEEYDNYVNSLNINLIDIKNKAKNDTDKYNDWFFLADLTFLDYTYNEICKLKSYKEEWITMDYPHISFFMPRFEVFSSEIDNDYYLQKLLDIEYNHIDSQLLQYKREIAKKIELQILRYYNKEEQYAGMLAEKLLSGELLFSDEFRNIVNSIDKDDLKEQLFEEIEMLDKLGMLSISGVSDKLAQKITKKIGNKISLKTIPIRLGK
ncbi:MAG: ATP-binding protein [Bacteroidales bacterium]|nr:ATP-binding protein [Bacteroidales bacterium]